MLPFTTRDSSQFLAQLHRAIQLSKLQFSTVSSDKLLSLQFSTAVLQFGLDTHTCTKKAAAGIVVTKIKFCQIYVLFFGEKSAIVLIFTLLESLKER